VTDWKLEQLPKFVTKSLSKSLATRGCFTARWQRTSSAWFRSTQTGCRWLRVGKKPDPNDATGAQVASLTQKQPSAERAGNSRGIRI